MLNYAEFIYIYPILILDFVCKRRLLDCSSRIVYERLPVPDNQVGYVVPVESILGKLPVVQVGDTGTIAYCMLQHAEDFVGAAFDTIDGASDGSKWWYLNNWALSWSREAAEKRGNPAFHNANYTPIIHACENI